MGIERSRVSTSRIAGLTGPLDAAAVPVINTNASRRSFQQRLQQITERSAVIVSRNP